MSLTVKHITVFNSSFKTRVLGAQRQRHVETEQTLVVIKPYVLSQLCNRVNQLEVKNTWSLLSWSNQKVGRENLSTIEGAIRLNGAGGVDQNVLLKYLVMVKWTPGLHIPLILTKNKILLSDALFNDDQHLLWVKAAEKGTRFFFVHFLS